MSTRMTPSYADVGFRLAFSAPLRLELRLELEDLFARAGLPYVVAAGR